MLDDENPLTPATILDVAWGIRKGTALPDDARRLLSHFCDLLDRKEDIPYELLSHLRDAFRSYLDGKRTLESSLGLTRKRGRPRADEETRTKMAAEVLRLRLEKTSHQDALAHVANHFSCADSVIGEAWAAHKQDAWIVLRLERMLGKNPLTQIEESRLSEIFRDEPWFIAPGKSPNKPA